jgi:hypothetical protein
MPPLPGAALVPRRSCRQHDGAEVSALPCGRARAARDVPDGRPLAPHGQAGREKVNARIPATRTLCENRNHLRRDAPVGYCPECGAVVNARAVASDCDEPKHAAARRRQTRFCVDCGRQLIASSTTA